MKQQHLFTALSLVLGLVMLSSSTQAQEMPGVEVGAKVKEFSLKDASDADWKLSEALAKGPVAIVFERSADW